MNEQAILLEHVSRKFNKFTAVDDLSLMVSSGEIFGLLGPNGAGKTTTLKMVTGLLPRSSGEIRVFGYDPQTQAKQVRRLIGLVAQETNLYADLTAVENLQHHAALYNSDLRNLDQQIEAQLQRMSLWERRKEPVRNFSGGMKRRLALARALLHDPQIIFFDEPTLGVDVQARHVIWQHIRDQRDNGKTFFVSTNDMNEAEALCDRLAIIDQGRLIALDSPENLKNSLKKDIVTLRTTPQLQDPEAIFAGLGIQSIHRPAPDQLRLDVDQAESIVGELIKRTASEYRLESLQISRPTLDDVFLFYTGRGLRE